MPIIVEAMVDANPDSYRPHGTERVGLGRIPAPYHKPKPPKTEPRTGAHVNCKGHIPHPYSGWLCVNPAAGETIESRAQDMRAFGDHLIHVTEWHHARELTRRALPAWGKVADATREVTETLPYATKPVTRMAHYDPAMDTNGTAWQPEDDATFAVIQAEVAAWQTPRAAASAAILGMSRRPAKTRKVAKLPAPRLISRPRAVPARHSANPGDCPRCGQTFRTDNGRAWHLANRPGCAAEAARRIA